MSMGPESGDLSHESLWARPNNICGITVVDFTVIWIIEVSLEKAFYEFLGPCHIQHISQIYLNSFQL